MIPRHIPCTVAISRPLPILSATALTRSATVPSNLSPREPSPYGLSARAPRLISGSMAFLLAGCTFNASGTGAGNATDTESSSSTATTGMETGTETADSTATVGTESDTGMETGTDTGMETGSTDGGDMGTPPTALRPQNGTTLPPTRAFLLWEDGMVPDNKMLAGYRLCWSDQGLASIQNGCPVEQLIDTTYDVIDSLQASTDYFWKVQACYDDQASDCSDFSDISDFSTDNSLIGWWKLDDGKADANTMQAADSSPTGNNGNLQNFTLPDAWNTGNTNALVGGALEFDGTNSYVELGDNYNFSESSPFTMEAWVRRSSVDADQVIFGKLDNSNPSERGYVFGFLDNNELLLALLSDDLTLDAIAVTTSDTYDTPDVPYHIAATYDGSMLAAGIQLYIDTIDANTTIEIDSLAGPIQTTVPAAIGATPDPFNNTIAESTMNGTSDDVMVYDRVLFAEEIMNSFCARETLNRQETGDQSALPAECSQ